MKKNLNISLTIVAISILFLSSCKDENKKESEVPISNKVNQEAAHAQGNAISNAEDEKAIALVNRYLTLKEALVSDDNELASQSSKKLMEKIENFEMSHYSNTEQAELQEILEEAMDHVEQMSESSIDIQREHFKALSKGVTDMLAITGTNTKLYEQYCPMYNNGSTWLSASKEIKNPYYGSKMLACGKVQQEIN